MLGYHKTERKHMRAMHTLCILISGVSKCYLTRKTINLGFINFPRGNFLREGGPTHKDYYSKDVLLLIKISSYVSEMTISIIFLLKKNKWFASVLLTLAPFFNCMPFIRKNENM